MVPAGATWNDDERAELLTVCRGASVRLHPDRCAVGGPPAPTRSPRGSSQVPDGVAAFPAPRRGLLGPSCCCCTRRTAPRRREGHPKAAQRRGGLRRRAPGGPGRQGVLLPGRPPGEAEGRVRVRRGRGRQGVLLPGRPPGEAEGRVRVRRGRGRQGVLLPGRPPGEAEACAWVRGESARGGRRPPLARPRGVGLGQTFGAALAPGVKRALLPLGQPGTSRLVPTCSPRCVCNARAWWWLRGARRPCTSGWGTPRWCRCVAAARAVGPHLHARPAPGPGARALSPPHTACGKQRLPD